MGFVPCHKGAVYVPERATKEENLTSYAVFGGVAIQNRIAASFFLWRKLRFIQSFACEKARSPPLRFDFKKIQIGGKER